MTAVMTCHEAIRDLDAALLDSVPIGMNYLLLGGIASAAYCDPTTRYENGNVIVGKNSNLSTLRDNGTPRDIDVLITGVTTPEEDAVMIAALEGVVDGQLEVSVSNFRKHQPEQRGIAKVMSNLKAWTSNRTVDEAGVWRYELFPLEKTVDPNSYNPWQLVTPSGHTVQVLHPVGHLLAYRMRSISGLRHKDTDKFVEMNRNVLDQPDFRDELYYGFFRDWFDFAQAIPAMLESELASTSKILVPNTSDTDLEVARLKGRALAKVEENDAVVRIAQSGGTVQKILDKIIGVR